METTSLNLIGETLSYAPTVLASLVCCKRQMRERVQSNISIFHRMLEELWPDNRNYRTLDLKKLIQVIYTHSFGVCFIPLLDVGNNQWRLFRSETRDSVEWVKSIVVYKQPPHFVFLSPVDVFFLGGQDNQQKQYNATFKANTRQNVLESAEPLIHARMYCGVVNYKSLVYVFGGYPQTSWDQAEIYDPKLNTWSLLPQLPVICKNADTGAFRDILYTAICESGRNNGRVIAFDPTNQTYSEQQKLCDSSVSHRILYGSQDSLLIYESGTSIYVSEGDGFRKDHKVDKFQAPIGEATRFGDWLYVACEEQCIFAINPELGTNYEI